MIHKLDITGLYILILRDKKTIKQIVEDESNFGAAAISFVLGNVMAFFMTDYLCNVIEKYGVK